MPDEESVTETASHPSLLEQARLEGVRLAARSLEHYLTNDLTLVVGYSELVVEDPDLPEHLRDMVSYVRDGAYAAMEVVRRARRLEHMAIVEDDSASAGLLDLRGGRQGGSASAAGDAE